MGIKPWHRLSLLVLAGAVLAGCNSTNPRDPKYIDSKAPPFGAQSNQNPPPFPTMSGNSDPFKSPFPPSTLQNPALANQQKPIFTPASNPNLPNQSPVVPPINPPFGIGPQPQPGLPLAPNPNQGLPTQSNSFAPPQIPAFQPLPPNGQMPLPGANYNEQIQGRSEFFGTQQSENRPPVQAPGNFAR